MWQIQICIYTNYMDEFPAIFDNLPFSAKVENGLFEKRVHLKKLSLRIL